jgi:hypothetical protein
MTVDLGLGRSSMFRSVYWNCRRKRHSEYTERVRAATSTRVTGSPTAVDAERRRAGAEGAADEGLLACTFEEDVGPEAAHGQGRSDAIRQRRDGARRDERERRGVEGAAVQLEGVDPRADLGGQRGVVDVVVGARRVVTTTGEASGRDGSTSRGR